MRIDYTLPGLDLGNVPELPPSTEIQTQRSFRDELRGGTVEPAATWQQQMGLEVRSKDASFVGPPPRPRSLEVGDAAGERMRWRKMLSMHSAELTGYENSDGARATESVRTMLEMLQSSQDSEDSLVSRNASLARG